MATKTNGDIYKLLNDLRMELKGDIQRVETKVDSIATDVNKMKVKDATLSYKVYSLMVAIGTVSSAIIYALAQRWFK